MPITRVILLQILLLQCCIVDRNVRILAFTLIALPHHEKISNIGVNHKTILSVTSTTRLTDVSIKSNDNSKQSVNSIKKRIQKRRTSKVPIVVDKATTSSSTSLPTASENISSTSTKKKSKKNNKSNTKRRPKKNDRMIELDGPLKPVKDLVLGSEIEGFVASFTPFGAFIKISYDIKGKNIPGFALLHKSQFMDERVDDLRDHLKIGQHLKKLRVINVNFDKGQVGVSLRKTRGKRMDFSEVLVGSEVVGKVTTVKSYGAFVDIGCKKNVLLHISRISQQKIENIRHFVKEGDVVKIRISDKDEKKKSLAGSMLSYSAERYVKKREMEKAKTRSEA